MTGPTSEPRPRGWVLWGFPLLLVGGGIVMGWFLRGLLQTCARVLAP